MIFLSLSNFLTTTPSSTDDRLEDVGVVFVLVFGDLGGLCCMVGGTGRGLAEFAFSPVVLLGLMGMAG